LWYNFGMRQFPIFSRRSTWAVLGITLLAFGLRIPFLESRTLTVDEASSLKWVAGNSMGYLLTHYHTNSHQLMSIFARLADFGGHWLSFYRGLSAWLGVLTVPLLYQLGRRLVSRRAGMLAALLLAVAPYHVDFSLQMRGYAAATFGATVSYYCIWQGLRRPARRYWLGLAAASVLTAYAHLFGALAIGAGWLIVAGHYLAARRNGVQPRWLKPALVGLLLTALGGLAVYAPILPRIINTPDIETDWPTQIVPLFADGRLSIDAIDDYLKVFRLYGPLGEPRSWLVWSFVALAGLGAIALVAGKTHRRAGWAILTWIFVPILMVVLGLQFVRGFYAYRRFFMFFQPLYLLAMAVGMLALSRGAGRAIKHPAVQPIALSLLVAVALGAAGWKLWDQTSEDTDNQWPMVAQTIVRQGGENPVVVCEPFNRAMTEEATHRDECFRNLEFFLQAQLAGPVPWLVREIDQVASIPGVAHRPAFKTESGFVWLVLWQRDWPPESAPVFAAAPPLDTYRVGSTLLLRTRAEDIHLLGLAQLADALTQLDTTPQDSFSYWLSQAQMQAMIGHRDRAEAAMRTAQTISPPGIDAAGRLAAVAELIGMSID